MELIKRYGCLILFLALMACDQDPVELLYADIGENQGVFIVCEGNFMYGNSSLSFYDKNNKQVFNHIFSGRNRAPLGDVAYSASSDGKNLYLVVNNSGKVVVVDPKTIEFRRAVTGLVSPRNIHFISAAKAYISDIYARGITIINPETGMKTGFIDLWDGKTGSQNHPTESFVKIGNRVFVSCWANDNQIMVINPENDSVTDSIRVPYQPGEMVVDKHQKLWVQCDGDFAGNGNEKPALVRIDPETLTIEQIFRWENKMEFGGHLAISSNRDSVYFVKDGLYKMAVNARYMPEMPYIPRNGRLIYSIGVDPKNGDIYLSDAIDYMQNAVVYRFTSGAAPLDTFKTGINPGSFWFN